VAKATIVITTARAVTERMKAAIGDTPCIFAPPNGFAKNIAQEVYKVHKVKNIIQNLKHLLNSDSIFEKFGKIKRPMFLGDLGLKL
jgi:hypothetical protein